MASGGGDLASKTASMLKALSNPIRLKILALCLKKERSSRELRDILGVSKPLLIVHLKQLVKKGFLEYRVEFDQERMIIRKYYRTRRGFKVCVDESILEKILREIEA